MQSNFPKIPLLLSIIFFLFSCSIFIFIYREINNKNAEAQAKEEEWQNEELRRDEIRALDRSIKLIEAERVELGTHFAKSSDIVPLLDTIEGLGLKVATKAEIVSVAISEDNTGLLVGMKAEGTFKDLYRFLMLLENSPYELDFSFMDLQKSPGEESIDPQWNVIFRVKLLSFIQ